MNTILRVPGVVLTSGIGPLEGLERKDGTLG